MYSQTSFSAEVNEMAALLRSSKQFEIQLNSLSERANPVAFAETQMQLTSYFNAARVAPSRTNVLELQYRGSSLL